MASLPWTEKYRPKTLSDIISHKEVIITLKKFVSEKTLPHILLYGPPGTGKTSAITACARELYGEQYVFMVLELNASDDRGIEMVRTRIKQFVMAKCNVYCEDKNLFKLVILDETDAMTRDAQAILRQIIEKYTKTTRFCLICNYIQNINVALQSRCQRFRFAPLIHEDIYTRMLSVIQNENINIREDAIHCVIKHSGGDMRKILNNMQSLSMIYTEQITEDHVNKCLGYPTSKEINKLFDMFANSDFKSIYEYIIGLKINSGVCLNDLITEIYSILENYILNNVDTKFDINKIIEKLRFIEYNVSSTSNDNIQIASFVGIFKNAIKE